MVRDTLVALLNLEADIKVAGALASGDQIVPTALEHRPDVALLDIGLPGINVASVRVAEKAGFRREGTLRRAGLEDDGLHDLAVFSLLDDEL